MPHRPYAAAWSPRIHFVLYGRKPARARLPGLEIAVAGKHGTPPRYLWRCCLNGLFSN